ncbi:hypothetical protein DL93DRAFT_2061938 [Clavulina sp. PMI_390]|nr:hypothetical protein DL93DRAFT_2061938 [Clavulina sp. PMI_390]
MSSTVESQLFAEYPELSNFPLEDLEDLLSDPAYFHAVFHSLPQVKGLFQAQSELGAANEAIAKRNLALQEELYKLRSETQAAFDDAKALQARQKELEREQKELYQRYSSSFLSLRLRHATTAQDDLSETLASSFVRSSTSSTTSTGSIDREVDDFVKEFKDIRKAYHKRAMWGEKWAHGSVQWREDR